MASTTASSSGGIGFLGLLTIVFITLKLTNFIDWSWLWVLAPLWIPFSIFLVIGGVILIAAYFAKPKYPSNRFGR